MTIRQDRTEAVLVVQRWLRKWRARSGRVVDAFPRACVYRWASG